MNASEQQKETTIGGKMPKKPYPYMAPVLSDYGKLTEVTLMATLNATINVVNLSAADVLTSP